MLPKLLTSIFGSRNERLLKQYRRTVQQINALEPKYEALTDDELRAQTAAFKERIAGGASVTTSCPRRLRSAARAASGRSRCATSMCS